MLKTKENAIDSTELEANENLLTMYFKIMLCYKACSFLFNTTNLEPDILHLSIYLSVKI